ncbi:hypothetical protein [Vulgatibacter incomptus]|uniref:Quinol:cytochrome C oxidoreductase n=1 Tax=Vulgatibacter incomptus TaxID=1391653 RepID=A0A0K1P9P3_9BACT|nr:hypothetical protein [Vulgatibacter incomptus]AKU90248.1 hypothetical protein AKJ08_0635 [Vulgatibacter incomptus]
MSRLQRRFVLACCLMIGVGLVGLLLGVWLDPRRFFFSYLAGWSFYVSTAIGGLLLLMIGHAARARWFAGMRRLGEYTASTLPAMAVLAIPIFLGMDTLYAWAGPREDMTELELAAVKHKALWMNTPFFIVRTELYLLALSAFAFFLIRWSLAEDAGYNEIRKHRMQRLASGGIPISAFLLTWASFDWLMSLDPTWYSTVFGVYFWAGGFVASLAVLSLLGWSFRRLELIPEEIGRFHQWATGRLMFAFVIFWAYQGFAQLLVIWIGNVPREITFYQHRANEGWGWVSLTLALGQFLVPFLVLLSRDLKKKPSALALVAGWLLFAHYVDIYWMVIPNLHPHGIVVHWLDLCALLAIGGVLGLWVLWLFRGRSTVPLGDPYYYQSLRYRGAP